MENRWRKSNIWIIEVPKGEKQNQGTELILKTIMQGNLPEIKKETCIYILKGLTGYLGKLP